MSIIQHPPSSYNWVYKRFSNTIFNGIFICITGCWFGLEILLDRRTVLSTEGDVTIGIDSVAYGGPQLSHQNQMLTSNSNRSHQIQIAHSKFKSLTANSNHSQQITNRSQQITNRSQQIQIAHSKFKSFTAN